MNPRLSSMRRHVKRLARSLWVKSHRALGAYSGASPAPGLRILTYHRVGVDPTDPFCVPPQSFFAQMKALADMGRVEALGRGVDDLAPGSAGRPRLAITVDDGTEDFAREVLPVVGQFRLPTTLYVSPERVGRPGFLDWNHLRQASESGVAIGSHGLDHRSLGKMPANEVARQLMESKRILEDRLGLEVTSLAYPYGTWKDFSPEVKRLAGRAGYHSACTSLNGLNRPGVDLLELRRTKIEQGDDPIFSAILAGCIDSWYFVDRYFSIIQNHYA